jgi:hypothetical protein
MSHVAILRHLKEAKESSFKAKLQDAVKLLREAAADAPSCQAQCDLATAIMNIEEVTASDVGKPE